MYEVRSSPIMQKGCFFLIVKPNVSLVLLVLWFDNASYLRTSKFKDLNFGPSWREINNRLYI